MIKCFQMVRLIIKLILHYLHFFIKFLLYIYNIKESFYVLMLRVL